MEVPIIITGWKTDLHKDKSQVKKLQKTGLEPVTSPRGQEMGKAVRRKGYLNCSAWLCENVFQKVAEVALSSRSSN